MEIEKKEQAFKLLDRETIGGLSLILATIIALVIANSKWSDAFHELLISDFIVGLPDHLNLTLTTEEWINDGLMVIFFVVAGLEIKREIMVGELSSVKKAAMPLLAALGGMVVPACIFILFNAGEESARGWAIPMATDIAYALGIMGLLERRIPTQLKVFLIALAIADDIAAILIIAAFYSSEIAWGQLALASGIFALLFILNILHVKGLIYYVLPGILFWLCFIHSGIHPTIAGVLFAMTIPANPKFSTRTFRERVKAHSTAVETTSFEPLHPIVDTGQRKVLELVNQDIKNSQPPLIRMENSLLAFNAYFIVPVFALANAGVRLDVGIVELITNSLGSGIILGLALGKVLGISLFSFIGNKVGIASLPANLTWTHIIGSGFIAGIGFTMSLFITNLAFSDPNMIKIAKISILTASLLSGVVGIIVLLSSRKISSHFKDPPRQDED